MLATRWFLWFWLKACGTNTPDFWTLHIECKCRTMVEWSQFITFASSRVHWHGSLWINVFKRSTWNPRRSSWTWSVTKSKRSSLKSENHFLAVFSPLPLSPYTAQMFLAASAAFIPLWTQRAECVRKVPISPLGTPFSSTHCSTHYLQMAKLQYVNSSTTIELQIKIDNR